MPNCMVEAQNGLLYVASGQDPVLRWDGLTPQMETAGVEPPDQAVTLSPSSSDGTIVGTYTAYLRYVDRLGNFSNLSPVSAELQINGGTGVITNATNATPIVITSSAHGLLTGQTVQVMDVVGNENANGTWPIVVIDADSFSLTGSVGNGAYQTGGSWGSGVDIVVYTNVETTSEPKVVRRQLLRNTDGQATTYYVDVDTTDLTSDTFSSTLTDVFLATQEAVPIIDSDGRNLANQYGVPPDFKAVLEPHLDRLFAAVDGVYAEGNVTLAFGSTTVQGIGTEWTSSLANRFLWAVGGDKPYQILAVDTDAQALTLYQPYTGSTLPYTAYAIRPAIPERRLVRYSESGLPEAFPPTNAISLQEDGDEITGLLAMTSFLYILEKRHIYRFTFQDDPQTDGFVFLSSNRGCINNRCRVVVEEVAYMLDEAGIHAFRGGFDTEPVSTSIQDIFQDGLLLPYRINWAASDFFHAVFDRQDEVIRWFVALGGAYLPLHALCYHIRLKRWWVEEYPQYVGAACVGVLAGQPQVFVGGPARRVYAFPYGTLDGPDPAGGTNRGTVTAATACSITDATAVFPGSGLVGSPVVLADGTGKGENRTIAAVSGTTLRLTQPWTILPDATTVYQIGGVPWSYRTGWFRFSTDEVNTPRRVEVVFDPVANPATLNARVYFDYSVDPNLWQVSFSSADHGGVRVDAGMPDLVCDLTRSRGFVQQRLDYRKELYADGPRFMSLQLGGVGSRDTLKVLSVSLDGVQ